MQIKLLQKESEIPLEELLAMYQKVYFDLFTWFLGTIYYDTFVIPSFIFRMAMQIMK